MAERWGPNQNFFFLLKKKSVASKNTSLFTYFTRWNARRLLVSAVLWKCGSTVGFWNGCWFGTQDRRQPAGHEPCRVTAFNRFRPGDNTEVLHIKQVLTYWSCSPRNASDVVLVSSNSVAWSPNINKVLLMLFKIVTMGSTLPLTWSIRSFLNWRSSDVTLALFIVSLLALLNTENSVSLCYKTATVVIAK